MPLTSTDSEQLSHLLVRRLGVMAYQESYDVMREFTANRDENTSDEIWLLEHPPTFTQGLNGKTEHLLDPGKIPLIQVDRGGQITYHGPGQLIAYLLLDLRRHKMGVRQLVTAMEQSVIDLVSNYGITANARTDAPGVYVGGAKIAAIGLRVKRGRSYHGLSLNIDMDLTPFSHINPCGHPGMVVTDLRTLGVTDSLEKITDKLLDQLKQQLSITITKS
jgi:lipoyl(octanoyl) transferase